MIEYESKSLDVRIDGSERRLTIPEKVQRAPENYRDVMTKLHLTDGTVLSGLKSDVRLTKDPILGSCIQGFIAYDNKWEYATIPAKSILWIEQKEMLHCSYDDGQIEVFFVY